MLGVSYLCITTHKSGYERHINSKSDIEEYIRNLIRWNKWETHLRRTRSATLAEVNFGTRLLLMVSISGTLISDDDDDVLVGSGSFFFFLVLAVLASFPAILVDACVRLPRLDRGSVGRRSMRLRLQSSSSSSSSSSSAKFRGRCKHTRL